MEGDIKGYGIKCLRDEADALLDLIPMLDDNFEKAVKLIFNAKGRIVVTYVGKSGHIGAKIAATLASNLLQVSMSILLMPTMVI